MSHKYLDRRSNLSIFHRKLSDMKIMLREIERNNDERALLQQKLEMSTTAYKRVKVYLHVLSLIKTNVIEEDLSFKNRRMSYVESFIKEKIDQVFPYDNFKVNIICDFSRNNNKATLRLIDRDGNARIPFLTEGGLNKQLISFSSSLGITKSFGKVILYVDEAFSASAPDIRPKLGDFIGEAVEEGMQVFMIAQSSESYRHLPRKEFHLEKDPITGCTVTINTLEY